MKKKVKKMYDWIGISVGTFLGWPLAGFYMLSKNSQVFRDGKSKNILRIGVTATIVFFRIIVSLDIQWVFWDGFGIADLTIPIIYTVIFNRYYNYAQWKKVEEIIKNEWDIYSIWNIIGVILLSLLIGLSIMIGIVLILV